MSEKDIENKEKSGCGAEIGGLLIIIVAAFIFFSDDEKKVDISQKTETVSPKQLELENDIVAQTLQPSIYGNFEQQSEVATQSLKCKNPKLTLGDNLYGDLYACVQGKEETVKFFINEDVDIKGRVSSVKVLWIDYTMDIGFGLHVDQLQADQMITVFANLYDSNNMESIKKVFFSNQNENLNTNDIVIEYTYHSGPAADERMMVIRFPREIK